MKDDMMMRMFLQAVYRVIVLSLIVLSPLPSLAKGMQPPGQTMPAESVEEPDSLDDDSMSAPQEESPPVPPKEAEKIKPDVKPAPDAGEQGDSNFDRVILQGLNKVTARAQAIEAPIGSAVRFGTVEIIAHRCWRSAPDERPENAALLEISEIKQGEAPTRIFLGWMFSSTPGLSALEHPFYDISVVKCEKAAAEVLPQAASAKGAGKKGTK